MKEKAFKGKLKDNKAFFNLLGEETILRIVTDGKADLKMCGLPTVMTSSVVFFIREQNCSTRMINRHVCE